MESLKNLGYDQLTYLCSIYPVDLNDPDEFKSRALPISYQKISKKSFLNNVLDVMTITGAFLALTIFRPKPLFAMNNFDEPVVSITSSSNNTFAHKPTTRILHEERQTSFELESTLAQSSTISEKKSEFSPASSLKRTTLEKQSAVDPPILETKENTTLEIKSKGEVQPQISTLVGFGYNSTTNQSVNFISSTNTQRHHTNTRLKPGERSLITPPFTRRAAFGSSQLSPQRPRSSFGIESTEMAQGTTSHSSWKHAYCPWSPTHEVGRRVHVVLVDKLGFHRHQVVQDL